MKILLKYNDYVIIFLNIGFVYAYNMDKRFYRPPEMVDYMFSVVSRFLLLARIVRRFVIQMQLFLWKICIIYEETFTYDFSSK